MWWTAVFEPEWTVSLLPQESSTPWMKVMDGISGDLAARDPVGLIAASRSDSDVPLAWLPYLAIERSVDEYNGTWPEARRRVVVSGSFRLHQVKGTRPALDRALSPLGYDIRVVEWFERYPEGPAYTFSLSVTIGDDETWAATDRAALIRVANRTKNAHTKLTRLDMRRTYGPGLIYVGGMITRRRTLTIKQVPRPDGITLPPAHIYVGGTLSIRRRLILGPKV